MGTFKFLYQGIFYLSFIFIVVAVLGSQNNRFKKYLERPNLFENWTLRIFSSPPLSKDKRADLCIDDGPLIFK